MTLRRIILSLSLSLVGSLPLSCVHHAPMDYEPAPMTNPYRGVQSLALETVPCLGTINDFCKNLYAPDNLGQLEIPLDKKTFAVKRGKTLNGFSHAYYEYARTQLLHKDKLPADFRTILIQRNYFSKLRSYLARKPRQEMNMEDRIAILRLSGEIDAIWTGAINQTVLQRMEKKFKGYSRTREDFIPVEWRNEAKRVRGTLSSQISQSIWNDHPNWKRVQRRFDEVREAYRWVLRHHPRIPEPVRQDWMARLETVRLLVPGGDPEVEMSDCSRTDENAYYYTKKNYVTVCAGDFNAEDITQTLAHEMAHAFDINRSLALHESGSHLGQRVSEIRRATCGGKQYSCSGWSGFKADLVSMSTQLESFEPQLPSFNRCLKQRETRTGPTDDYISSVAAQEVQSTLSDLAEENVFLRLITASLPMPDGTQRPNPAYMNPCGYYTWGDDTPPYDEDFTLLLFFTAEYRCSSHLPIEERFRNSIEVAKEIQTRIVGAKIRNEGEFSSRWKLNADGYAASPTERFADTLGGFVFAYLLKKQPDLSTRRATYLANTGWLCPKPSIRNLFPREAAILKQYFAEPHSENSQRQRELLSAPIREALQCKVDFEPKECEL